MKDFIKVMKALSDPSRVKVVKMLQRKVMCVCEIQAALGLAQPTVSQHLKVLEEAGLLTCRKEGLWVNCNLTEAPASPFAATMLGLLNVWLDAEPEVEELVRQLDSFRREEICRKC